MSGATLQINAGATVNLGAAADALSDGVDFVNVVNNSTASGFNVTTGTKNIGNLDGTGNSSVASGATLIAGRVRQGSFNASGVLTIRDGGTPASVSAVGGLTI